MSWLQKYRLQLYIRNSIWIFPALGIFAALGAVRIVSYIDRSYGLEMNFNLEMARAIMGTIAGSIFTLVVLVTSAVLVAVQLASGQLTPRMIALIYRNPFRKIALTIFVFTFTFSVAALARLADRVPLLMTYLVIYGFIFNLIMFLFLIDSVGKTLRPSSVLRMVALLGRRIVHSVYPRRFDESHSAASEPIAVLTDEPRRIVFSAEDGALLAFDVKGLVDLAEKANCLIELVPEVGDYVAAGDPLFRIYQNGETISDEALHSSVALGQERTMEQDPMFAFRIMVDIASRALSPAINDPTTAVLAVDQIHHLLREVGKRDLAEGCEKDSAGHVRLVYRTPNWEDFVYLAVTEIRQYGRDSIQIMRRLRAMLENLMETVPMQRVPLLRKELKLLENSSKRNFPDLEDQILAKKSDRQGMGGSGERILETVEANSVVSKSNAA